ncbi:hypothetical protein K439DRAFT_24124 [Ramaria rubella]|nr:hypothetical protein K439DRAFT_24124 [Ramaria rubella]
MDEYGNMLFDTFVMAASHVSPKRDRVMSEPSVLLQIHELVMAKIRRALRATPLAQEGYTRLKLGAGDLAPIKYSNVKPDFVAFPVYEDDMEDEDMEESDEYTEEEEENSNEETSNNEDDSEDEVSNKYGDLPAPRLVGDVKCSWKVASSWRTHPTYPNQVEFEAVSAQINHYMNQARTRYGYIITDTELWIYRKNDNAVASKVEVTPGIPLTLFDQEQTFTKEDGRVTPLLALWYLHMCASNDSNWSVKTNSDDGSNNGLSNNHSYQVSSNNHSSVD